MRVFFVDEVNCFFVPERNLSEMGSFFFHGVAHRRDGRDLGSAARQYYGDSEMSDAFLSRSGVCIPPIFSPGHTLMLIEAVAESLRSLSNVLLLPATHAKLVNLYVDRHDWSMETWWDEKVRSTEVCIDPFEFLPDDPALHHVAPKVYELVVPRYERVVAQFSRKGMRRVEYFMMPPHGTDEPRAIEVSQEFLAVFPISFNGQYIMSEDAFSKISDSLDRDFYRVCERTIQ
jgi:hypothetical protein